MGKSQHYVPRFYLKRFGRSERQIDLLHLPTGRLVRGASLRDQCCRDYFYGRDQKLEDAFRRQEGNAAAVLSDLLAVLRTPASESRAWTELILFVATLRLRTEATARISEHSIARAVAELRNEFPDVPDEVLGGFRPPSDPRAPLLSALQAALPWAIHADDLRPLLLTARAPSFITSDHPVCLYNTFARNVRGMGTTAPIHKGIQVFLPLDPRTCLVLYDAETYRVASKKNRAAATESDVGHVNRVVASQAWESIYFGPWLSDRQVFRLRDRVVRARETPRVEFEMGDVVLTPNERAEGEAKVVLQMSFPFPLTGLKLSIMELRREAASIPDRYRGHRWRTRFEQLKRAAPSGAPREWISRRTGIRWRAREQ